MTMETPPVALAPRRPFFPAEHIAPIFLLWLAIFVTSLFSPPLLDDADATHAQAAQAIVHTGDWVTLHVNGIRYLEKPPLPYWLGAIGFRLFGFNTFAAHFPAAIVILALALLGYLWARQAWNERAALYTSLATLTTVGVFLFTRILIPEALLSFLLCVSLYSFLHALDSDCPNSRFHPYIMWTALALAVLTKGLVVLVFFFFSAFLFLAVTGTFRDWPRLRPLSGFALFLLLAAPWHILATIRNPAPPGGHGFAWFYFINEHVLRFLGRRFPRDYNKLPALLYWSLHLIWLFPWSLIAPPAAILAWRNRRHIRANTSTYASRSTLLLSMYAALVLLFFAFSTNQEYYTFPVYLPLLMLLCASLAHTERSFEQDAQLRRWTFVSHSAFILLGAAIACALAFGLWSARTLPYNPDVGSVLAHRGVGNYTLSMSRFFDLTGPSFAALRLPSALALLAFTFGPVTALVLRHKRQHIASTTCIALTSAVFLVAAHIALGRFSPILSSRNFADRITQLHSANLIAPDTQVLLLGDQAYGSSIPFYLGHPVLLVDGRSSSMLFGSTFPDTPPIFLSSTDLLTQWGYGPRKLLFVPAEKRDEANRLLGSNQIVLEETSGKALLTDRPLSTSTAGISH